MNAKKTFKTTALLSAAVLAGISLAGSAGAATLNSVLDPNLSGTEKYDGWAGLIGVNYPGYGGFFTSGNPWPGPIASNQPGSSGDVAANKAQFNKVSGEGYLGGEVVYMGGPSGIGGVYSVTETNEIDNLANVVFQVQIQTSGGNSFQPGGAPTLTYNGGTAVPAGAAKGGYVWAQAPNGTFTPPGGEAQPLMTDVWAFQWDLSGIAGDIADFKIQFTGVAHAGIHAIRLDQSTVYATVVPEPATLGLVGLAVAGLACGRRRRSPR
ncbi:MAG TPA: PEP-CTERM sorting domain-containing protein [Tepidisphaeraceae bacterium]|nr:PEP-CTERM sorting domain-containing protein [Tepidisphaeraceae bacterium]